jgi:hypothetical protein
MSNTTNKNLNDEREKKMSKWKVFLKKRRGGKYGCYKDRVCIIISSSQSDPKILVTPALKKLMKDVGGIDKVLLLSNGEGMIGIRGVRLSDPQIEFTYALSGKQERISYIAAKSFIRENGLEPGTVCENIYFEGDMVVANKNDFVPVRHKV